jgi:hypothetical protein
MLGGHVALGQLGVTADHGEVAVAEDLLEGEDVARLARPTVELSVPASSSIRPTTRSGDSGDPPVAT